MHPINRIYFDTSCCYKKILFFLECYEIYFLPNTCGNHWLNVNLNHIPIADNPCRLTIRPSSSSATKTISASGQGLFHAYTGER